MTTINIENSLVLNGNGFASVELTLEAMRDQVEKACSVHNELAARVSEAVHAVFNSNTDKQVLPVGVVIFEAVKLLAPEHSALAKMELAVHQFIKHSAAFKISRGKNGGVSRV